MKPFDFATMTEDQKDEVLARARLQYTRDVKAQEHWMEEARKDQEFLIPGKQWDAQLRAEREGQRLPCLEENRVLQTILLVTNDAKQNRPGIQASPVDDRGDPETATLIEGHLRNIENDSDADVAYDAALWNAAGPGVGAAQVAAISEGPTSFDQKLVILPILGVESVVFDAAAQLPTAADGGHVFVMRDISWNAFEAEFPDSSASVDRQGAYPRSWESLGHDLPEWVSENGCRIADYYERDWVTATLFRIPADDSSLDPSIRAAWLEAAVSVQPEILPGTMDVLHTDPAPEGVEVLREHKTRYPRVMHYKLSAHEILDATVWSDNPVADPNGWLPVVRMTGLRMVLSDGTVDYVGMVRPERDPQRLYNYTLSALAVTLGIASQASYMAYEGQIEHDPNWQTMNTRRHVALTAKASPTGWHPDWGPAPFPTRNTDEPPIQAITQALQIFGNGIDTTSGQYPSARGQASNETSGVAIQARKEQSTVVTYHLIDNFHRMIRQLARVLVSQIPIRYDSARTLRIVGEDLTTRQVAVNQPTQQAGENRFFDLTAGRYDIVLSAEPMYATRRKQAAAAMPEIARWMPVIGQIGPDIATRILDLGPYSKQLAERLKRWVRQTNPSVLGPEDADPEEKAGPSPEQQQIEQLQQQVQAAQSNQEYQQKTLDLQAKKIDLEWAKLAQERELAILTLKEKAYEVDAKLGQEEAVSVMDAELDAAKQEHAAQQAMQQQQMTMMSGPEGAPPAPGDGQGEPA